jgi:acetyltransferase-like isoleucine patch superfamily enzyme
MRIAVRIRRGEGPFWSRVKWLAKKTLNFHLPVFWLTRPIFSFFYFCHVAVREGIGRAVRLLWYEPLFRSQCAAVGEGFTMGPLPYLNGTGRITLGNHVTFGGKPNFIFGNRLNAEPELVIGDHTFIGHGCCFAVAKSLRIGNHCLIAGDVRISDYDGHPVDAERRRAGEPTPSESVRAVVIHDDVWVGERVLILKGVTIGPRSIVGAGSVVTRDVPPDVVVAGNPARIVKRLTEQEPGA